MSLTYQRILLKLSGEALEGTKDNGIDPSTLDSIAREIQQVCSLGVQLAIVIGGGNIFRGLSGAAKGMNRIIADSMGMLATAINCLAFHDKLERIGQKSVVLSAVPLGSFVEPFSQHRAIGALEKGEVVLLAAGTGNPYFTTDTAAALRALEIQADALVKATKVDGIYDKDPLVHQDAIRFDQLTYEQVLEGRLKVMDLTAFTLCRENHLPLIVFNLNQKGNILKVVQGEHVGSLIVE